MLPVLKPGNQVLTFNWFYLFSSLKKNDIIIIYIDGREIIKRIQNIKNEQIFVVGDNQSLSIDSRSFGPIDKSDIIGKVILIF